MSKYRKEIKGYEEDTKHPAGRSNTVGMPGDNG